MKSRTKYGIAAAGFVLIGLVVGLVLSSTIGINTKGYGQEYKISKKAVQTLTAISDAMADVAAAVKPSVVNISTVSIVKTPGIENPLFNQPFFKHFFGTPLFPQLPSEQRQMSLGSGVIVDPNGIILTNDHVVKGAQKITVTIGQNSYKGKVIGADAKTDLAVVRINAHGLPAIKWGDSDKLRAGDTVMAIGSPFGLTRTVTSGIVSAVGRANVGIAAYEDFIQTDAAINPGNSGGALVNARGELVGINTAIFSTTGGYEGIGFAIPSNMARTVMEELIKTGHVTRGWLGVWIQPVSAELQKQFGLKNGKGALVADFTQGSPAQKAGMERGDFIVEYNGKAVQDPNELRNMVANTRPGAVVPMTVIRQGRRVTLQVKIGEQPKEVAQVQKPSMENALSGVNVQDLTPALRQTLGIPARIKGVVVTQVAEGSPAQDVLEQGDVIMELNHGKITNMAEYLAQARGIGKNQSVLLLVYRQGQVFYVTISTQ
ncbi:MAG: DegQ family serine endoprotease [Nitrospiraceae bacterium]|nr:DegQ family serine endoprotease [Nitrospiraceae bacterium]